MIIDQVGGFSYFFKDSDVFWGEKFWNYIFDIGTSPAPSSELFVLGTDTSIDRSLIDEIHLANSWSVDDSKSSIPSEIASPVLHPIFHDRIFIPIVCPLKTQERLAIDGKISIKFWILTLKKLPHSCPSCDNARKKCSLIPVVRINWSELVDGSMSLIGREKSLGDNRKKSFLNLCVRVDCWNKSMSRVEWLHFLVGLNRIGDICSFYFSFVFEPIRMNDIDDCPLTSMVFYNLFCMLWRVRSTSFGCKKDGYILFILVFIL